MEGAVKGQWKSRDRGSKGRIAGAETHSRPSYDHVVRTAVLRGSGVLRGGGVLRDCIVKRRAGGMAAKTTLGGGGWGGGGVHMITDGMALFGSA